MNEKVHYLKTWMGYTSGTFMGRDDGYPEMKSVIITDTITLARTYGTSPDEKYYLLTEADVSNVVDRTLAEIELEREAEERKRDEEEFEKLKRKLGKEE